MKAIQFQSHPAVQVALLFLIGLLFLPLGVYFVNQATLITEYQYHYDGPDTATNCSISTGNQGTDCSVSFYLGRNFESICSRITLPFIC
jgi:hypothetical protein